MESVFVMISPPVISYLPHLRYVPEDVYIKNTSSIGAAKALNVSTLHGPASTLQHLNVVSHTARYDYAYSEVRGEFVCRGAQTTD